MPRLLKAVDQAFRQRALAEMRAGGIETLFPGAVPLVLHLGDEDGLPLSELGRRCGLESSTMSPLVDELERQRVAERVRDPEDRRVVRLYLTQQGREIEPRLRAMILRLQQTAMHGIHDDDLGVMRQVLNRILANLDGEPDS